jgi:hypothetical protein
MASDDVFELPDDLPVPAVKFRCSKCDARSDANKNTGHDIEGVVAKFTSTGM